MSGQDEECQILRRVSICRMESASSQDSQGTREHQGRALPLSGTGVTRQAGRFCIYVEIPSVSVSAQAH